MVGENEVTVTIKAGLGESGLSRPSKVGGKLVAEAGFEPATSGL